MFSEGERIVLAVIVIVYFIFLFALSLYISRRVKTYEDYNLSGRTVPLFPLILTFVGTAIGGSTLLGYMENGYMFGMGQQWLNIGSLIAGTLLALFLLKRIRKLGEKYNMVTIGDYTALRYGEKARIPTVISVLVAYCAITGMQFVAIATILNLTLDLSMTTGILIGWVLLTLKTYFGGLKAVIWQDAIHGTIQTVGVVVLFFAVLMVAGGWGNVAENAQSVNEGNMMSIFNIAPSEVFVFLLTIGAYQFLRQDLWQRIWAANTPKTARNGYWISIILAFLTGVFVVAIGVFARYGLGLENIDPVLIYYAVTENVFPFIMVIVMIIAVLATVISTADSFFISGASSIVNDVIRPRVKQFNNAKMMFYSRISVVIVSFIALFLALTVPGLVNLWVTGTAMLVAGLLAPVMFGLYWKRVTSIAGVTSMWLGLGAAVLWQILGHPFDIHPVFIGLPLSIVTLLVITFLTKQHEKDTETSTHF